MIPQDPKLKPLPSISSAEQGQLAGWALGLDSLVSQLKSKEPVCFVELHSSERSTIIPSVLISGACSG